METKNLVELLRKEKRNIVSEKENDNKYLWVGYADYDKIVNKLDDFLEEKNQSTHQELYDEQIWTFLLACGYAIAGKEGVSRITKLLAPGKTSSFDGSKIWFEVLPVSPRVKEGQTHLDLALGTIKLRDKSNKSLEQTKSGIELLPLPDSWICFCEMKWYSDISHDVTYDIHRNQLARVIETALTFQNARSFADAVHVTLVTPGVFYDSKLKSRLYQYKFKEYHDKHSEIINDINECLLATKETTTIWEYPVHIEDNLKKLSLHWVTFEELFQNLPESLISKEIKYFENKYNKSSNQIRHEIK